MKKQLDISGAAVAWNASYRDNGLNQQMTRSSPWTKSLDTLLANIDTKNANKNNSVLIHFYEHTNINSKITVFLALCSTFVCTISEQYFWNRFFSWPGPVAAMSTSKPAAKLVVSGKLWSTFVTRLCNTTWQVTTFRSASLLSCLQSARIFKKKLASPSNLSWHTHQMVLHFQLDESTLPFIRIGNFPEAAMSALLTSSSTFLTLLAPPKTLQRNFAHSTRLTATFEWTPTSSLVKDFNRTDSIASKDSVSFATPAGLMYYFLNVLFSAQIFLELPARNVLFECASPLSFSLGQASRKVCGAAFFCT